MSSWGMEPREKLLAFPCDKYLTRFDAVVFRGVTIQAPVNLVFRWLCQLRIAPYSYDWIDNLGRKSPQYLVAGTDDLAVGQKMMGFAIIDFELDKQITLKGESPIFGNILGSYLLTPKTPNSCRLLVKGYVEYPKGLTGSIMRLFLARGDLVMMRRQLLNIKALAEQTFDVSEPH